MTKKIQTIFVMCLMMSLVLSPALETEAHDIPSTIKEMTTSKESMSFIKGANEDELDDEESDVPSFSTTAKKMKAYSKKLNKVKYTTLKKGKQAVLDFRRMEYSEENEALLSVKQITFMPRIVLNKDGAGSRITYKIYGVFGKGDIWSDTVVIPNKIKFICGNKSVTLKADASKSTTEKGDGFYYHSSYFSCSIADSQESGITDYKQIMKYIKSGKCKIKVICEEGESILMKVKPKSFIKEFKRSAKVYNDLLKNY